MWFNKLKLWLKNLILKIWIYIKPFFNWRFLISFSIPWFIVNGWAWAGAALMTIIGPNWFTIAATTWLGILWLPWTPEKLVTIPIAMWIHTRLFKNDKKTRIDLQIMYTQAQRDWENIKNKFRRKNKHGKSRSTRNDCQSNRDDDRTSKQ